MGCSQAHIETASIGCSFRTASELNVPQLSGFLVWYGSIYAGRVKCSELFTDVEGAAARIFSYARSPE